MYRRGFVEITPGIHEGKVNVETFEISADADVEGAVWVDDEKLQAQDIVSNTEIELSPEEAESLANALLEAAEFARGK